MKTLRYITYLAASLCLASCSDEAMAPDITSTQGDGLTITVGMEIPDMGAGTRSMGETADLNDLELVVLEFEWGESYAARFLHEIHTAIPAKKIEGKTVYFDIKTIEHTDEHRVLHLIAHPTSHDQKIDLGGMTAASNIIPRLYAGNGYDMYSARVDFPDGYSKPDYRDNEGKLHWKMRDDVVGKLTNVPMLRNFASIEVKMKDDANADFSLEGFCVVNKPRYGTAEPWDETKRIVPDFTVGSELSGTLKSYEYLTYTDEYKGFMPTQEFDNRHIDPIADSKFHLGPEYMYERPYEDSDWRTYVIVKGKRAGKENSSYYKLDIGTNNETTGLFEPFNILRNFKYTLSIDKVNADGYPTAKEAVEGSVFNNQIGSFDAQALTSISDGNYLITASKVEHVFVNNDPITLTFTYNQLNANGTTTNLSGGLTSDENLAAGGVIKSFTESYDEVKKEYKVTIVPNAPSNSVKTQKFTVFYPNGLSRTVKLTLRNPYTISDIEAYHGNWYNRTNASEQGGLEADKVSMGNQKYVTLYFNLEDGINESLFPITFTIESKQQELENNNFEGGKMVVQTARSLYYDDPDYDRDMPVMQFVRTVTLNEYTFIPYSDVESQFTEHKNTYHTIRCRFLTTSEVTEEQISNIRIVSDYFRQADDTYTRSIDKDEDYPEETIPDWGLLNKPGQQN